eukprot:524239_1
MKTLIAGLLILITIINITNQTDCGTQMEIWSDNAEDMTTNWQFDDANTPANSHAISNQSLCHTGSCYEMTLEGGTNNKPNFVTNPNLFNTILYTDVTIKYA